MSSFDVIVVGLHLRWDGVWQRPNHLLSRFSNHVPVIVVEQPLAAPHDRDVVSVRGEVTIVTPHRTAAADAVDDAVCRTVRTLVGSRRPLVWLYSAQMLALSDAFARAPLIFDKMDELTRFKDADPRIALREPVVLKRAAICFAGGSTLFASLEHRALRARCYASGVEIEHFSAARSVAPAAELNVLPQPRFGYVGVIDERLDFALLDGVAVARPDWTIVMVGPTAKIDPASLPKLSNITYLGQRSYDDLPALLAGCNAAIMPFALNDATRSISPTKTLEYLAAGLGVASTAVDDVVRDYSGIVEFGGDPATFAAAMERALHPDARRVRLAADRVRAASWDLIARAMWDDVIDATNGEVAQAV